MEDRRLPSSIFDPPSQFTFAVHLSGELNFKRVPLFEWSQEVMTFADD
jgi:hypothetical protein